MQTFVNKEDNIEYAYILDVVEEYGCSVQSLRYLIKEGNVVRKMKAIRDRGRILIPVKELQGFPFVRRGSALGSREIYHYDSEGNKVLCTACSFTNKFCESRIIADSLNVVGESPF